MKIDGKYGTFDFDKMSEQDVREEIVTPLLHELGYKTSTENDILRGEPLKHPYLKYGHRETPIICIPDYILDIKKQIRWVLDAKAPIEEIGCDYINQTYSYAAHREVVGQYFVICNGLEFKVYKTFIYDEKSEPLLCIKYQELNDRFEEIRNLLAPKALYRDFEAITQDRGGDSLGAGLRSWARVVKGIVVFKSNDVRLRSFDGLTTTILGGSLSRNECGFLCCVLNTCAPYVVMQEINRSLGLDSFQITSKSSKLSSDPKKPTEFASQNTIYIPKGTSLPIQGSIVQQFPYDIKCEVSVQAFGSLKGSEFNGNFVADYHYTIIYPEQTVGKCNMPFTQRGFDLTLNGEYFVELD